MNKEEILSTKEVAEFLGLSKKVAKTKLLSGEIPSIKLGENTSKRFVRLSDILLYNERKKQTVKVFESNFLLKPFSFFSEEYKMKLIKKHNEKIILKNQEETFNFIIDFVCNYFGQKREDVFKISRKEEFVLPRQTIEFFLIETKLWGYSSLSRIFERHHSTIIHSVKTINNFIETNKTFERKIVYLRTEIFKRIKV